MSIKKIKALFGTSQETVNEQYVPTSAVHPGL